MALIIILCIVLLFFILNKKNNTNQKINEPFLTTISKSVNPPFSKEVIFFDVETNGLEENDSVLSIAAFKVIIDSNLEKVQIKEKYMRYYYPIETYNFEAININNLTESFVDNKRIGINYSRYFIDDMKNFYDFIGNAEHFVAHNIKFDRMFVGRRLKHQFCTMLTNTSIVKAKRFRSGKYKWPKLCEAADYYNILVEDSKLHDSYYDVELTVKVFEKMCSHSVARKYIKNFIGSDTSYLLEI